MKTLCEHCVFYKKQEKECALNLLEQFSHTMGENGPIIDGLCRSCRNIYWKEYSPDLQVSQLIGKVVEENQIEYDVIIGYLEEDEKRELLRTLDSLTRVMIKPKTIIIASNRNYLLNQSLWSELKQEYPHFNFVINFCGYDTYESLLDYSLNKVKSEFVLNTICGCTMENATIDALNQQIFTPTFFLAFYKDSQMYFAESAILRHSVLTKPSEVGTIDYIKQNLSHIGIVIESTTR